jgi:heme/copper-type cytochrome/quinol oxidase subunit 2
VVPTARTNEEVLQGLIDEGVPTITIGDVQVPLTAGSFGQYAWALLNLIMALAGIVLGVVTALRAIARKKREDEGTDEYEAYETEDEAQKRKQRRLVFLIGSILMAVLGIVVFLVTEDITRLMVLIDNWTIVNFIILVVEVLGSILAFKRKKQDKKVSEEA